MGNLMLAAHALGVASCWIHRAKEEFERPEGKQILKELGITLQAYTSSIGPVSCQTYHPEVIKENSSICRIWLLPKNAIKISRELYAKE
mgnify:CR=1 FL=1